jgi:hypothetical protein
LSPAALILAFATLTSCHEDYYVAPQENASAGTTTTYFWILCILAFIAVPTLYWLNPDDDLTYGGVVSWCLEFISEEPQVSRTYAAVPSDEDEDLYAEGEIHPDFLENLGIPKTHPSYELITRGFEAHLCQVKEVLQDRMNQSFGTAQGRWINERTTLQQTIQELLSATQRYYNEFLGSQENLAQALSQSERNTRCLKLINDTALDIARKAGNDIPKKRVPREIMPTCEDIVHILRGWDKDHRRLINLEKMTREAIQRVLNDAPIPNAPDLTELYIDESVDLIRAAETVASGHVPPPSGSNLIRELRAEIRVAHREHDALLGRYERLETWANEVERRYSDAESPSTDGSDSENNNQDASNSVGGGGARPNQSTGDNSSTNGNATQTPVTYPTLPPWNRRVSTLREEPQQSTTSSSNNATESSTSTSAAASGISPAQPRVNTTTLAAETRRPSARVPFMAPPQGGYTSSIPEIRTQAPPAPTATSSTSSEGSEELPSMTPSKDGDTSPCPQVHTEGPPAPTAASPTDSEESEEL